MNIKKQIQLLERLSKKEVVLVENTTAMIATPSLPLSKKEVLKRTNNTYTVLDEALEEGFAVQTPSPKTGIDPAF